MKDKSGVSFPLVIGVTPLLLLISCGVNEYFRLQIITAGVWDAIEDTIISTVNDSYAGVYHGVREGRSDGYMPYREGEWERMLDEGDTYARIDEVLGIGKSGRRYVKFVGNSGNVVELTLMDLNVTLHSAPLTPSDPGNAQCFKAEAVIRLEVPVQSGRKFLSSAHITLRVQAGYTEVF